MQVGNLRKFRETCQAISPSTRLADLTLTRKDDFVIVSNGLFKRLFYRMITRATNNATHCMGTQLERPLRVHQPAPVGR